MPVVRETYRIPAPTSRTARSKSKPHETADLRECHRLASKAALCEVRRRSCHQPRRTAG